jgi:hypothetical protein
MPYSDAQRRRFHAGAARGEPGMAELAAEADAYARKGKTTRRKTTKKAARAKTKRRGRSRG